VWREAREEEFGVRWLGGIAFLWDLKMAEATEDEFAGTCGGFVMGECGDRRKFETARGTGVSGVVYGVVLLTTEGCIASKSVVGTVPVVLECCRSLLEDLAAALGT
jgi:hypothetical protein